MRKRRVRAGRGGWVSVVGVLLIVAACSSTETPSSGPSAVSASTPSPTAATTSSSTPGAGTTPFPYSAEPVPFEPGTYRIPASAWSVADLTITFPESWTVQYGHVYAKHPDTDQELGFYAVVVDSIHADACVGSEGELVEVGPSVDDLATALLQQTGPMATGPVSTTLGGYPAVRVDLAVPAGFDLEPCNASGIGLQIWYSPPADKNFVLLPDGIASAYIVDVEGQRQVFLVQRADSSSDEDLLELQTVLDSIRIEP